MAAYDALHVPPTALEQGGVEVLRAAIVNHRTRGEDVDALADSVVATGVRLDGTSVRQASEIAV